MNVKAVNRDGERVIKGQCPTCGLWADLDDDQIHGRVSIQCPRAGCTYHETLDLSAFVPPAERAREIGRACLEEMNPVNYDGRNYESWVEIIDRHHAAALAERPDDMCACGRSTYEAVGDSLQDHELTCSVYLAAALAEARRALDDIEREHEGCDEGCSVREVARRVRAALAADRS